MRKNKTFGFGRLAFNPYACKISRAINNQVTKKIWFSRQKQSFKILELQPIDNKVIDSTGYTFRVRLDLPNAEKQMPSGLRCLVLFEIYQNVDQVTAQIVSGQVNSK